MADYVALIGAIASALALLGTAVRRRQDVDLDEMKARVDDLSNRLATAEKELGELRAQVVRDQAALFAYRRALAGAGLPDPTETSASP